MIFTPSDEDLIMCGVPIVIGIIATILYMLLK